MEENRTGKNKQRRRRKKTGAAILQKQEALRARISEALETYDPEAVSDREWEKLIQDATRRINVSFSNDRFSIYGTRLHKGDERRGRFYNDMVTARNYDDFLDNLHANVDDLIARALDPDGLILRYITHRLIRFNSFLAEAVRSFSGNGRELFADEVYARLSRTGIGDNLSARLHHYCTRRRIENLIGRNVNYESIAKNAKGVRASRKQIEKYILEKIPDNYIDLYPEARDMERHFVLHIGPTNSGKTHDALEELRTAPSGVYLAPLRLLACEVKDRLNEAGTPCDLRRLSFTKRRGICRPRSKCWIPVAFMMWRSLMRRR